MALFPFNGAVLNNLGGSSASAISSDAYFCHETGPAPAEGNTEMLADLLFKDYLLPFELTSILLLVAVVGSVIMAKKRI